MIFRGFMDIEVGLKDPEFIKQCELTRNTYSIDLSISKEIESSGSQSVLSMDFDASDYQYLIAGHGHSNIAIYDLKKIMCEGSYQFQEILTIGRTHPKALKYGVNIVKWYPSDTGMFISASGDKRLCLWDTNELDVIYEKRFESLILSLDMSKLSVESYIAMGVDKYNMVQLMDLKTGFVTQTMRGHQGPITSVRWHPTHENLLLSGSRDGTIRMWDIRRAGTVFVYDRTQFEAKQSNYQKLHQAPTTTARSHTKAITDIIFTPCGQYLLSCGMDYKLRLWDADLGHCKPVGFNFTCPDKDFRPKLAVSNNSAIVYITSKRSIFAYEIQSGIRVNKLKGHYSDINCLTFHPILPQLYSGSADKNIIVWDPSIQYT